MTKESLPLPALMVAAMLGARMLKMSLPPAPLMVSGDVPVIVAPLSPTEVELLRLNVSAADVPSTIRLFVPAPPVRVALMARPESSMVLLPFPPSTLICVIELMGTPVLFTTPLIVTWRFPPELAARIVSFPGAPKIEATPAEGLARLRFTVDAVVATTPIGVPVSLTVNPNDDVKLPKMKFGV